MPDIEQNTSDLAAEKLKLEIEELKNNLSSSKTSKVWHDYLKPVIPVIITLVIAIFGSLITSNFNNSQLTITKEKNQADKEIAQIDASLSYIKLMTEIPDSSVQLRRQAKSVIAPALPPETSFYLAVDDLPEDPFFLDFLINSHPNEYWKYLMTYLENNPSFLSNNPFRKPIEELPLFDYLEKRDLIKPFYQFMFSDSCNARYRINALVNYLDFIYTNEDLGGNPSGNTKLKTLLIEKTIKETSDLTIKADVSKAGSVVLDQWQSQHIYTELAAKYFWVGYDVSIGEVPKGKSVEQFIYSNRFHLGYTHPSTSKQLPVLDSLSNSLFVELSKLNFHSFEIDRVSVILYSYCESIYTEPFRSYLNSEHTFSLMDKILQQIHGKKRKQEFSMHLGSMSGHQLYRNVSQDKAAGREYAKMIIKWYEMNWQPDWYIPKFMHDISMDYPELKSEIDKDWGVGIN